MKTILTTEIIFLLRIAKTSVLALALLIMGYSAAPAASPNVMIGTDMGHTDLYLFNMDSDHGRFEQGPDVAGGRGTAHHHDSGW